MKILYNICKNIQDYYPRKKNNELTKSPNTKCKSCGNSIRISKKRIKLEILEIREKFIIFQTDLRKILNKDIFIEILTNYLIIKNLELLNLGIVEIKTKKFKIFLEKFKINNKEIIYGEVKKKMYNNLSHIEIYDDKINFLFKKLSPNENLISYLEMCKILYIEIQENLINLIKIPLLVQPLDIAYYNM